MAEVLRSFDDLIHARGVGYRTRVVGRLAEDRALSNRLGRCRCFPAEPPLSSAPFAGWPQPNSYHRPESKRGL